MKLFREESLDFGNKMKLFREESLDFGINATYISHI
jgi:hypothetical protein